MLNHVHLLGKAFVMNPPQDEVVANDWLTKLVEKINMKVLMGPYSINCKTLGNEGVTGVVVIETSHASFHCWSEVERPFFMFDVYSCVDFSPMDVLKHLDDYFDIDEVTYGFYDRNDGAKLIEQKTLNWRPSQHI